MNLSKKSKFRPLILGMRKNDKKLCHVEPNLVCFIEVKKVKSRLDLILKISKFSIFLEPIILKLPISNPLILSLKSTNLASKKMSFKIPKPNRKFLLPKFPWSRKLPQRVWLNEWQKSVLLFCRCLEFEEPYRRSKDPKVPIKLQQLMNRGRSHQSRLKSQTRNR